MSNRLLTVLCVLLVACGKDRKQATPQDIDQLDSLRGLYAERLAEAERVRDPETGWLARWDCDAMIWSAKYAAVTGASGVDVLRAEYPEQPGRFGRRPPPWCWSPELGDRGSSTSWSRDMAVAGLLPYAWLRADRALLERHAAYGYQQAWWMGEPTADGRTYYTPQVRGVLFKAIRALGGPGSAEELWPALWPSGLVDYEAHLQVMSIWLQGEVARRLEDPDAVPEKPVEALTDTFQLLSVSNEMYLRLQEHASREPSCALYQSVLALYTGDFAPAVQVLLDPLRPRCSYVRCGESDQCELAEWLFAADMVLRKYDDEDGR